MADTILLLIAGTVIFQFVVGLYAYVDANRRSLEYPELYFYGISMPLVGFLVLGVYLTRREELPTQDLSAPESTEAADDAVWTVETRGLRRLPRRLAYSIHGGRTLWRVAVAVPPILLLLAVLVDPRVTIVLVAFCGVFWLTYLGTASAFTYTTVDLDPTTGTIQVTSRGGNHPLSTSGSEHEVDLADVQRADLRRVGSQVLATFAFENSFSTTPRSLLVPPENVAVLRSTLSEHDVPVRDRIRDGASGRVVRRRYVEGLFSLLLVPLAGGILWPQSLTTQPVPLLVFFVVLWLGVKLVAELAGYVRSLLGVVRGSA